MTRENLAAPPVLTHGFETHTKYVYELRVNPFKIIGNVYYVGDLFCPSYLIDTGDGIVLLDTPFSPSTYLLVESIWELGFDPRNIRYIIHSHGHGDHYGCTIPLVQLSGCKTVMSTVDAEQLDQWVQTGHPYHRAYYYESFSPDIRLNDGDFFSCGNLKLRSVSVPGHTPGAMAYFWDVEEDGKTYTCGTFGGTGFNTLSHKYCDENGVPKSIREDFIKSLDKIRNEKVDVHIGNHQFQSFMMEKHELQKSGQCKENPFVDPDEWKWFIDKTKESYLAFKEKDDENYFRESKK